MSKRIKISIEVDVEDSISEEQIADLVKNAVTVGSSDVSNIGDLNIISIKKDDEEDVAAAYSSRAWSKTTC